MTRPKLLSFPSGMISSLSNYGNEASYVFWMHSDSQCFFGAFFHFSVFVWPQLIPFGVVSTGLGSSFLSLTPHGTGFLRRLKKRGERKGERDRRKERVRRGRREGERMRASS